MPISLSNQGEIPLPIPLTCQSCERRLGVHTIHSTSSQLTGLRAGALRTLATASVRQLQ